MKSKTMQLCLWQKWIPQHSLLTGSQEPLTPSWPHPARDRDRESRERLYKSAAFGNHLMILNPKTLNSHWIQGSVLEETKPIGSSLGYKMLALYFFYVFLLVYFLWQLGSDQEKVTIVARSFVSHLLPYRLWAGVGLLALPKTTKCPGLCE